MATTRSSTSRHLEVERTYEVPTGAVVPPLLDVQGVASVAAPVVHHLDAVYHDTAGLRLAARRITLRRRTGGDDAGWTVKLPSTGDARTELQQPLGRNTRTVPPAVLELVRVHVRDEPLGPVARVRNHRTVHRLLDADGRVLAEVCDDDVTAEALGESGGMARWREWEVELVGGDTELLDAVAEVLATAGATLSTSPSKLVRALGFRIPNPQPAARPVHRRSSAGDAVTAALRAQVHALWSWEPAVRADDTDAVHQARVTVRTLRSLLVTYRPVLERSTTDPVRDELRWFGGVLGAARDAEVARATCAALLDDEPSGLVLGPVPARIADTLDAAHARAHAAVVDALDGARWFRLLDALDALLADAGPARASTGRAGQVLPQCVHHDWVRLRRSVSALDGAASPAERAALLHEVRKAAKRLRHGAESAAVVVGRPARRTARRARDVQRVLGTAQDAILARQVLRDTAAAADAAGEPTFTYGRLDARVEAGASHVEEDFAVAWAALDRAKVRGWLRA
ncbi:CYTH and CHAD domain-containing protein [Rhodococcus antarcticus]|jgi:CHAD domain-containing protein|uniref:CYTH and CHAD domain-containing protein n=1 Tax=Rhodococcus antarcticus TaxID=2987751 RepID=A0ABY6NXS1_9NOCA|nr:CYTH and CHAD domain-containing protein [Rhodococcus antarcticus]UZJ24194.1 CYTH and CHAD domain-containing protein [Rhodococcus antarcticus]